MTLIFTDFFICKNQRHLFFVNYHHEPKGRFYTTLRHQPSTVGVLLFLNCPLFFRKIYLVINK